MKKKSTIEAYKGMSFSDASLKIKSKYPQADVDLIQKNSLKVELEQLMQFQEKKKLVSQMQEVVKQFKKGGMLPKYPYGGPLYDGLKLGYDLVNQPLVPPADNLFDSASLNNALSTNAINTTIPNVPSGNDPWSGIKEQPLSTNNQYEMPKGRPEVNAYTKASLTPGVGLDTPKNFMSYDEALNRDAGNIDNSDKSLFQVPSNNKVSTLEDANTKKEMSAYTPALLGQGLSTALNLGILAKGYDKVSPVENPYESQVKNLLASRGIDTTQQRNQILSAYQAAKNNINNARSANVRNALDTNLMNTTQDSLASSKLQEQQLNNAYVGEYANALSGLGQAKVAARTYAEQLNTDSKSNWQSGVSELGKHLADMGLSQTTLKLNNIQQTAIANILSQKYPNFTIGKEALKNYLNGTYTDEEFVKLKEAAANNPELTSILDFAAFQKQQKENTK